MMSMKMPRKNSASVNEIASCICERSEEMRLLNSPTLFSVKKLIGILSSLLYTSLRISAKDLSPTAVSKYTLMNEKKVCTVSWQKISSNAVFKLQWMFFNPNPNFEPVAIPGSAAPGEAASIIFPRKSGNKLVENAVSAMNTMPRMNLPR